MHSFAFNTFQVSFSTTWLTVAEHRGNGNNLQLYNNDDNYIPLAKNNTTSRLTLINSLRAWNEFPDHSVKLESKNITFNIKLKSNFFDLIPENPTCTRANCPNCMPGGS
jgi:hypothetical protein